MVSSDQVKPKTNRLSPSWQKLCNSKEDLKLIESSSSDSGSTRTQPYANMGEPKRAKLCKGRKLSMVTKSRVDSSSSRQAVP